jgi:thiosulfate reductase/polysulfide reductase chain A
MAFTRREFIKTTGTATAAYSVLASSGCLKRVEHKTTDVSTVAEEFVPGVCLQCPGGCGILVKTVDGRAVKIEGNPAYPSNRGKTCPKGQIGLQILYDPDRIRGPLKRDGARGSGKWKPIPWDQAIAEVAGRLNEVRASGHPESLTVIGGRYRGQMGDIFGRFCDAFGTPNNVGHSSICEDGSPMAHWATQGFKSYAGYDWENCRYVLTFGGSFLEAWRPTAANLARYGSMRRGHEGQRFKLVVVDPRFSVTAAQADEWIPVNPVTDAALALGIAHVIIRERLYNRAFVEERTFGFEDFTGADGRRHEGFKTLVLREYDPARASKITGVPEKTIVRIAHEFAATQPAIAAGARGASMQTNGIYNRMAIHALNGLMGTIDSHGGVLVQNGPPFSPFPVLQQDDLAKRGAAMPRLDYAHTARYPIAGKVYQDIPDRITEQKPYATKALLLYYTNPMFSTPEVDRWRAAISKLDLVVTFSPFMDESSAHADYVLPDHTYLERWHDDVIYPSVGYPVWGMRMPAVAPVFDTRNAGDVLFAIAQRMGGTVAASFPWNNMQEMLRARARGIFEARAGSVQAGDFESWWKTFLQRGVWTNPPYEFASDDPARWKRVLSTPSGRFEFYSQGLEKELTHLAEEGAGGSAAHGAHAAAAGAERERAVQKNLDEMLSQLGISARGDTVYLPHFEPPRFVGNEREYPLHFITYKTVTHAEGRGANTPMVQEHFNVQTGEAWTADCQMNPDTARRLGLTDGAKIIVESSKGAIEARVRFAPHHPQVVVMPHELGHTHYGELARGRGANPNHVIANENDRLGGLAAFSATRVRVRPA